ncbi:hypothetical protein V8E53_004460 [Lactarius tabidus]
MTVCERTEGEAGLSSPSQMDVLLVRWLGFDSPDGQSGWRVRQLHKVGFLPDTDVHGPAFGFLDPREVIQMVHLIPDFASIRTKDLLTRHVKAFLLQQLSLSCPRFSDRDLFMRYCGGGVRHMATRQCNEVLLADKHTLLQEEPPAQDSDSDEDPDERAREGNEGEEEGDESDDEDEGVREENDDDLVAANNDVQLVTAAGFADL